MLVVVFVVVVDFDLSLFELNGNAVLKLLECTINTAFLFQWLHL